VHLDEKVGAGQWVVMVTSDHGLMPDTERSGGFAIKGQEVLADINAEFDQVDNDEDLAYHLTAYGAYIDEDELARNEVSLEEIGRWLAGYTLGENVSEGQELAETFEERESERLFSAVMSGTERVDPCRSEE
ncbi:MAG TPA: hypothetical protein VFD47_13140, partial [Actinomycetota bacterium]|nr:hypothetical protein [Actinomycetota bacterium]